MPHTVVRRAKEFAYLHDSIYNFSVYYDEARSTVRLMGSVFGSSVTCMWHLHVVQYLVRCWPAWESRPAEMLAKSEMVAKS